VLAPLDQVKRDIASLGESIARPLLQLRAETKATISGERGVQIPDRDNRRDALESDFSGHTTSL
jgi:hypothetical protein